MDRTIKKTIIRLVLKIGLCLFPLLLMIVYSIVSKDSSLFSNLLTAVTKIDLKLVVNTLLLCVAFIVLLLCGFRIYGLILRALGIPMKAGSTMTTLLASFILGSIASFFFLMTIGVPGIYYTIVLWIAVLLFLFVPFNIGLFLKDAKDLITSIKIKFDTGFLLFVLALVYFGIPILLVQLTSPFPPCIDILEVYIAPITRVLGFHQYVPDNSMPAAYYNAFRAVPLHTGLYSFIASLTGMSAHEAVTGSLVFILFFSLLSVYFLARFLGGRLAGGIAVFLFAASSNFMHSTSARAGIFAMIYFLPGFAFYIRMMLEKEKRQRILYAILAGASFGAAALMHPVVGAYVIFCIFLVFIFSKLWISPEAFWEGGYTLIVSSALASLLLFNFKDFFGLSHIHIVLIVTGFVLLMIPLVLFLRSASKGYVSVDRYPIKGKRVWAPLLILFVSVLSFFIFKWKSPWHDEPPLFNLFRLSPLIFSFGMLALARIAWKFFGNRPFPVSRYTSGTILLLGASVVIAFSCTMYIYPIMNLQGVLNMSFSMEIPGKGIDFFILPILVVLGGLVITGIKNRLLRFSILPVLMLLVVLPSQILLSSVFKYFEQTAQTSLYARAEEQVYFAAYGYFGNWDGDARSPISGKNLSFIDHIKKLISKGDITVRDTIVHVSVEQDPWKALPFWVITGVNQTLLLVSRNPDDIFTAFGRLYDFPTSLDLASPPKWLLVEQAVDYTQYREVSEFIRTRYTVEFSNERITLFRLMCI